jgi:threonine/homoserine/homoserine lactone efflux protein
MTIDYGIFFSIISLYILVVISPGPNFVLICKYALNSSKKLASFATIGLAIGATVNASLTMFGVSFLIKSYPYFDLIISVLGGSFLIYIGTMEIVSSRKKNRSNSLDENEENARSLEEKYQNQSKFSACSVGFLTNLLNPKGIAFFTSLYGPIVSSALFQTKILILSASFVVELAWYGIVILFLSRNKIRRIYVHYQFVLDFCLGAILLLLGAYIIMRIFI